MSNERVCAQRRCSMLWLCNLCRRRSQFWSFGWSIPGCKRDGRDICTTEQHDHLKIGNGFIEHAVPLHRSRAERLQKVSMFKICTSKRRSNLSKLCSCRQAEVTCAQQYRKKISPGKIPKYSPCCMHRNCRATCVLIEVCTGYYQR